MDERVTAHVFLELAKANNKLAILEALEREVPVLSGTSRARLRLSRRITNARSLAQSWAKAYALIETGAFDTGAALKRLADDAGLAKEFPPERTVAHAEYVADGPDRIYCNRHECFRMAPAGQRLTPLAAYDLPNGAVCVRCGTDVLA